MNRRQKLVQQQYLNNEKAVIDRLRYIYDQSLFDVNSKIRGLEFQIGDLTETYDWMDDDDPQKEIMRSRIQSKIYQKQYQEALQGQLDEVLKKMQTKQFLTVSDYLDECYTDGFVGTVFDQHGQGVPLIMPIDQEAMVRAVQLDSKISQGLYTRLGEDVGVLKKRITSEVTRSIATGASYAQVAKRLSNQTKIGFNRAVRIARTEGHRIQCTAAMDAMIAAKDKGADVLKQWDATLDDVTRESHRHVDGEIRELDEEFSNHLQFAGDPAGGAAEVINCRCAVLQRARWALDEDELQTLKDRAAYFGLDKSEEFDDFKKKYLKAVEEPPMPTFDRTLPTMDYDVVIKGLNTARPTTTLSDKGKVRIVTFAKGENVEWDNLSAAVHHTIRWKVPQRTDKPFTIAKGVYTVQPYVDGSPPRMRCEELAKNIGGEYVGTHWYFKYGIPFEIDFYQTDAGIVYSVGKASVKKTWKSGALDNVKAIMAERETQIIQALKKKGVDVSQLKERSGDDWSRAMKEFHSIIGVDGKPSVVSDSAYDAIKSPVLYRGIAPQSHLRKDITNTLTPKQMADGFFTDKQPFPSRGVYGDGVAYAAPDLVNIAGNYASAYGTIRSGGKIIEFKLKEDAKTISYKDALELFQEISGSTKSELLFAKQQKKAFDKEVGKAMGALGYDAIIEENGDNTGIPFYVILNRAALVTKADWTTVTITPEVLRRWGK